MTITPLSDEILLEAVALRKQHPSTAAAAQAGGLPLTTLKNRLKSAAKRGLLGFAPPVIEGFEIKQISAVDPASKAWVKQIPERAQQFEMPAGQVLRRVSAYVDADNNIIGQWIMTKEGDDGIDWIATLKDAFKEYEGRAAPVPPPEAVDADFLNLLPCNDWHINLMTWRREVGENWDLKIAEQKIGEAINAVLARTRKAGKAIILGGGDTMHNDDNTNRTAKSGNLLEADGRHQKGIEVAQRLIVRTIDAALINNGEVVVRWLKGNHDEYSSVAIAHFLAAWYRQEPRVTIDLDASLFWYYEFGEVMLSATHGHTVKLSAMPQIMAHRQAEMWGRTKYRYAHGFHIHHKEKIATEGEGVICEAHQAPIPQDTFHFGSGYLSGRSVKTITYHKQYGEWTSVREPVMEVIELPAGLTRAQT